MHVPAKHHGDNKARSHVGLVVINLNSSLHVCILATIKTRTSDKGLYNLFTKDSILWLSLTSKDSLPTRDSSTGVNFSFLKASCRMVLGLHLKFKVILTESDKDF